MNQVERKISRALEIVGQGLQERIDKKEIDKKSDPFLSIAQMTLSILSVVSGMNESEHETYMDNIEKYVLNPLEGKGVYIPSSGDFILETWGL